MAFLLVTDSCLDNDHYSCPAFVDQPPPDSEICGGGICVCHCHEVFTEDHPLYIDVRDRSLELRLKRS